MEELKKVIDLKALGDDEISKRDISLASLWMVKDENDKVHGPYDTESLKVYISKYQYLFENTKTYNLESEKWSDTFSIDHFQRRKTSAVATSSEIQTNEFYIYLNKQQSGPYSKDEVQAFLNNGQLKPDSPISIDKGESWIKVFEHHAFDRRSHKTNQELPFRPDKDILDHMALTKEEILKAREKDEAIVELAFLGHQKGQGTPESEVQEAKPSFQLSKGMKIGLGSFAILALVVAVSLNLIGKMSEGDVKNFDILSKTPIEKTTPKSSPKIKTPTKRIKAKKVVTRKSTPRAKVQPRRFPARAKKRTIVRKPVKEPKIEQENEDIDINDPEIQEEITRQLSGDYDLDGDPIDDENFDDYDDVDKDRDDEYLGDEDPIDLEEEY